VIFKFPNRNRRISTPRLKRLLAVHLEPINVIISYGPQTISDLGVGFPLRCFQRLSIPDIAMLRCPWQDNSHTRGQFTPVLSSLRHPKMPLSPISRSVDYTFLPPPVMGGLHLTHASCRSHQRNDSSAHESMYLST